MIKMEEGGGRHVRKGRRLTGRYLRRSCGQRNKWAERLRASSAAPFVYLGLVLIAIIALVLLTIYVIVPKVQEWTTPKVEEQPDLSVPIITPQPEDQGFDDDIKEVLLTYNIIASPVKYGDEIAYVSGKDKDGFSSLGKVLIYNTKDKTTSEVAGITKQNDNLLELQMNERWIVYLDSKEMGGGLICAYDRQKNTGFVMKEYRLAMPKVRLSGDKVVFTEQTSAQKDKVFLYDLNTQESVAMALMRGIPSYVTSAPDICESEVVWAGKDPNAHDDKKNAIYSYPLTGTAGEQPSIFATETVVHDPMTNGRVRAWSDALKEPEVTQLYISVDGGAAIKVDEGVVEYDLGENFVAYTKGEVLYAYFWEDNRRVQVSKEGEKAMLAHASEDSVVWFDITDETRSRDILKYAVIG